MIMMPVEPPHLCNFLLCQRVQCELDNGIMAISVNNFLRGTEVLEARTYDPRLSYSIRELIALRGPSELELQILD